MTMTDPQRAFTGQSSFMRFATVGERQVARKLVTQLLAHGYEISVHDGTETTVKREVIRSTILDALCTTGEDSLYVHTVDGRRLGSFLLVWGNAEDGSELIADHADNETCNGVYAAVYGENGQ